MARNFYYGKDTNVVEGSAGFSALINQDAQAYGLSVEQAQGYAADDAELQVAFLAAVTPATRTAIAVERKNAAMKKVQRRAAALAQLISRTETVDDSQLVALGLQPRRRPAVREAPTTAPLVKIVSVVGRVVTVRIRAHPSEGGGRKPVSALGANVYSFVGSEAPTDRRQYHFEGLATRATYEIVFANEVPGGATVLISAAWVTKRGATSTACEPVAATIQGGPILAMSPGAA